MTQRVSGVLAAALAVSDLLAGAGQASAASSTTPTSKATASLTLMTPAQYRSAQQARGAGVYTASTHVVGKAVVRPNDPPTPWYEIYASYRDESNRDIPVRQGYSDADEVDAGAFGFYHSCFDHNICSYAITRESGTAKGNNKFQYELYLVDSNLNIDVDIILVQTQNKTDYEGENTPDGRPIGLITAYCAGYTDWPGGGQRRELTGRPPSHPSTSAEVLRVGCPGSRARR